jgi:transcriptional regulator with XRE-family HTH domain
MECKLLLEKIQQERRARGYSRRDIGRILGISGQQVYAIEKGVTPLKMTYFFSLCEAFQVSPQEFFANLVPEKCCSLAVRIAALPERERLILQNLVMLMELPTNGL